VIGALKSAKIPACWTAQRREYVVQALDEVQTRLRRRLSSR
jgi:hypothetical protein